MSSPDQLATVLGTVAVLLVVYVLWLRSWKRWVRAQALRHGRFA